MGKISPVSSKYIIHSIIEVDGVVDRPDIIGAIFGQTEGLLGEDLELRELQKSGRIGRIEVNVDTKTGKTKGSIVIPSSLDKAETAIVGAAIEIIQRIGPCNAKIRVDHVEDVRISKRHAVIERAKELLKQMMDTVMPDSQELSDEVAYSIRVMEIQEYGKERLPAGPTVDESEEVIVVEGRADVLNLLKHGFKNVIAINGTSIPETIKDLCKKKVVTIFVDGDRGGNLILREITSIAEVDYITRAPDGKEVEEITKKEIHKALRGRITAEQAKFELGIVKESLRPDYSDLRELREPKKQEQRSEQRPDKQEQRSERNERPEQRSERPERNEPRIAPKPVQEFRKPMPVAAPQKITDHEKSAFREMVEDLIGTRGAYLLDAKLNILGKVPYSELAATLKNLNNVYAIVFDEVVTKELAQIAERQNVVHLVGMESKMKPGETRCSVVTINEL